MSVLGATTVQVSPVQVTVTPSPATVVVQSSGTGIPGPPGPAGPAGPAGPPGAGGSTYTFTQATAAATWAIVHNLGRHPSVTVVDSTGRVCLGDVVYQDANTLTATFSAPFAGMAYLN